VGWVVLRDYVIDSKTALFGGFGSKTQFRVGLAFLIALFSPLYPSPFSVQLRFIGCDRARTMASERFVNRGIARRNTNRDGAAFC
jgi:hypothetical protein